MQLQTLGEGSSDRSGENPAKLAGPPPIRGGGQQGRNRGPGGTSPRNHWRSTAPLAAMGEPPLGR